MTPCALTSMRQLVGIVLQYCLDFFSVEEQQTLKSFIYLTSSNLSTCKDKQAAESRSNLLDLEM